jgi:hypothetical protein
MQFMGGYWFMVVLPYQSVIPIRSLHIRDINVCLVWENEDLAPSRSLGELTSMLLPSKQKENKMSPLYLSSLIRKFISIG